MAIIDNAGQEGVFVWKPYPKEIPVVEKIKYWLKKWLPEVETIDIENINGRKYIPWN